MIFPCIRLPSMSATRTDGHGQPICRTSATTAAAAATSTRVPMAATWIAATETEEIVPAGRWNVSAEFIITGVCCGCNVASDVLYVTGP